MHGGGQKKGTIVSTATYSGFELHFSQWYLEILMQDLSSVLQEVWTTAKRNDKKAYLIEFMHITMCMRIQGCLLDVGNGAEH